MTLVRQNWSPFFISPARSRAAVCASRAFSVPSWLSSLCHSLRTRKVTRSDSSENLRCGLATGERPPCVALLTVVRRSFSTRRRSTSVTKRLSISGARRPHEAPTERPRRHHPRECHLAAVESDVDQRRLHCRWLFRNAREWPGRGWLVGPAASTTWSGPYSRPR